MLEWGDYKLIIYFMKSCNSTLKQKLVVNLGRLLIEDEED